jgi:Fe-S oxidoreductase
VIHHTEFLNELLDKGKIITKKTNQKITYHDSCYLGRGNKIYEAPRSIINSISKNLIEMKRNKEKGLCCGAGGAQIFKESENGTAEINIERIKEVEKSNAEIVVSACPFCLTMINDGIKEEEIDSKIQVKDIAELLEENLND